MELKFERAKVEDASDWLLIVPYGIEMCSCPSKYLAFTSLLIVPYGIEINLLIFGKSSSHTFNRTLWN